MHSDPIADLLTRIRNAQNAGHVKITAGHSNTKVNILEVLKRRRFIANYKDSTDAKGHKAIEVTLIEDRHPLTLTRISKPGRRIYIKNSELKPIKSGLGIAIISTSKGVMTNGEAKKQNLGGEHICTIY